ncbi:MAG: hypothetical protein HC902_06385 [Calothrix sp. SM1_5_4]|nr:hypothetical protein [Calothrix sp. SM1_5_4]
MVDDYLRVKGQTRLFAVGDCAELESRSLSKSGVHAVRQGEILIHNLRAAVTGEGEAAMMAYRPRKPGLALMVSGDRRALLSYRGFALEGKGRYRQKDRIDREFMAKYGGQREFTVLADARMAGAGMVDGNTCGGGGGKMDPAMLHAVLERLGEKSQAEDVGWMGGWAVSVDGFRTFTPDLYLFGRVAVYHALNDLFATGVFAHGVTVNAVLPPAAGRIRENRFEHLMAGVFAALKEMKSAF